MPVSMNNTQVVFNDATTQTTSGVTSVGAGTGISSTGGKTPTLTNTGVTSLVAGTGISVSGGTGAVTVAATGGYIGLRSQFFTASGTFTVPAGITAVKVSVTGGGGGGGGGQADFNGNPGGSGTAGGSSIFSSVTSGGGGGGGGGSGAGAGATGANGTRTGGTYIQTQFTRVSDLNAFGQAGSGRQGGICSSAGGSGGNSNNLVANLTGLTPGASISVTVGAAGNGGGGGGSGTGPGFAGTAGCVLVEF